MIVRRQFSLLAVALAAALGIALALHAHQRPAAQVSPPSAPVVGQSLKPLLIYRRIDEVAAASAKASAHQRVAPDINEAGTSFIVDRRPTITLHVQYATVREISSTQVGRTQWMIELFAPEGSTFTLASNAGDAYVAVLDDEAMPLLFASGSDDGSNFSFPAGVDQGEAISLAQQLTTSVTIEPAGS